MLQEMSPEGYLFFVVIEYVQNTWNNINQADRNKVKKERERVASGKREEGM